MSVTIHHQKRGSALAPVLLAIVAGVFVAGCCACCSKHDSGDGSSTGQTPGAGGQTVTGRVVSQPPGPGQVGIERWRFVPEGEAATGTYLRLTRARMQEAIGPEAKEIRLDEWAGKKIVVRYQGRDESWVWGAEVLR